MSAPSDAPTQSTKADWRLRDARVQQQTIRIFADLPQFIVSPLIVILRRAKITDVFQGTDKSIIT